MDLHHIPSKKQLFAVGGGLVILTILTVAVAYIHIPAPFNVAVALLIAFAKASLVAAFFMELYWDRRFNSMLLILSVLFVFLLIGLSLLDIVFRENLIATF